MTVRVGISTHSRLGEGQCSTGSLLHVPQSNLVIVAHTGQSPCFDVLAKIAAQIPGRSQVDFPSTEQGGQFNLQSGEAEGSSLHELNQHIDVAVGTMVRPQSRTEQCKPTDVMHPAERSEFRLRDRPLWVDTWHCHLSMSNSDVVFPDGFRFPSSSSSRAEPRMRRQFERCTRYPTVPVVNAVEGSEVPLVRVHGDRSHHSLSRRSMSSSDNPKWWPISWMIVLCTRSSRESSPSAQASRSGRR